MRLLRLQGFLNSAQNKKGVSLVGKIKDLAGQRFGELTVIEPAGRSPKGDMLWRCICRRCGNECVVEGQRLTDKKSPKKDCGCKKREKTADLTGKIYGALTVLKRTGIDKHRNALYLCKCSMCGSEKEFPAQTIRNKPKGCGCQQYKIEEMKKYSDLAVKAKFVETGGTKRADIAAVKSDKAMIRSKTGVRGVMLEKNGKTYRVAVQVSGERWVKTGFLSIESAKSAYDSKKRELLEKYGLDQMH